MLGDVVALMLQRQVGMQTAAAQCVSRLWSVGSDVRSARVHTNLALSYLFQVLDMFHCKNYSLNSYVLYPTLPGRRHRIRKHISIAAGDRAIPQDLSSKMFSYTHDTLLRCSFCPIGCWSY
jgi:hypothetical protein